MTVEKFDESWLLRVNTFKDTTSKFSGGQVVIIGGSELFHGAPIMALKACSRIVGMLYFSGPKEDRSVVEKIKSEVQSFVWVPGDDLDGYVGKSDAVLIGPGMMRSHTKEHGFVCDDEGQKTRELVLDLFLKFPKKKWVIDGGALQVISADEIPEGAVVTPNSKEFEMLFGVPQPNSLIERCELVALLAKKYKVVILTKDETSIVSDGEKTVEIPGGSDGLVKGGVGDVTAGVILGFLAKDDPILSCSVASFLVKIAGRKLTEERGLMFSSQDLAERIPLVYGELLTQL